MSSSEDDIPLAARAQMKPPPLNVKGTTSYLATRLMLDSNIPVKNRPTTNQLISKSVDDLVDREVDSARTPKLNPKSTVNKSLNSDGTSKKKRIIMSDDESEDDVPLVLESHRNTD
jgi:hypothetical protein